MRMNDVKDIKGFWTLLFQFAWLIISHLFHPRFTTERKYYLGVIVLCNTEIILKSLVENNPEERAQIWTMIIRLVMPSKITYITTLQSSVIYLYTL